MLTAAYERSIAVQRGMGVPITPRGPVTRRATGGQILDQEHLHQTQFQQHYQMENTFLEQMQLKVLAFQCWMILNKNGKLVFY